MTQGFDLQNWLAQHTAAMRAEMDAKLNQVAGGLRRQLAEKQKDFDQKLHELSNIAGALSMQRTGSGVVRIEDIPGRRVPYDFIVDIPIGNNTTSQREGSLTVSQEGPFVAVRRFATFQSAFEYRIEDSGETFRFAGRSFGRYRPIHSAWDLNDAQSSGTVTLPLPLGGSLSVVGYPALTSSQSGFRTMEFDGRFFVENAGSSFPRQNISVPSPFWTTQVNSPQDLAALDFFERGEVITFRVQPNHVNNPPAGNANGDTIFGSAGWPFLDGQYDQHEGIATPSAFSTSGATPPVTTRLTDDVVTRLPDGILTIGYLGYRIQQPMGPVG